MTKAPLQGLRAAFAAAAFLAVVPAMGQEARLSPVEAIALAQERFEGEAIDVEIDDAEKHEPAGPVYEIKLLTADGDVVEVRVDAVNGLYLGAAGDNLLRARRPVASADGPRR